ncbi:GNAT family N-acetyltransferase [Bacillus sp. JCM 19041]|uniref:GNAT family N-acetyltransferase n=1 Tax=Bacillus sp. JCM 19041 TaxID=1460637 RepID=UPI0006D21879
MHAMYASEMTLEDARQISVWSYDEPYSMYSMDSSIETVEELIAGDYYAVYSQSMLIGFYCTGRSAQVPSAKLQGVYSEGYIDIGLGLKPNMTGKGYGKDFMSFILDEVLKHSPKTRLRLTVAKWNTRAIRLYERFSFVEVKQFSRNKMTFLVMKQKKELKHQPENWPMLLVLFSKLIHFYLCKHT